MDENDAQTQQKFTEHLELVFQATIFDRLKAMGKTEKETKWIPHELNEIQQEDRNTMSVKKHELLARYEL